MSAWHVSSGKTDLRLAPHAAAEIETELLRGESVSVSGVTGSWSAATVTFGDWTYGGYIPTRDLCSLSFAPTHRVIRPRAPVLSAPSLKAVTHGYLEPGCRVRVVEEAENHVRIDPLGWMFRGHLAVVDTVVPDYVSTIEQLVGVPFVWGGRSTSGLDCSGMLEVGLRAAGIPCARRMVHLSRSLGRTLQANERPLRGDFLFYSAHCGMFVDESRVINCNGKYGHVEIEPFDELHHRMTTVRGFEFQCIRRLENVGGATAPERPHAPL